MQNLYFGVHFLFQALSAAAQSPKYLTVYVVLDKALVSPCQPLFPCLCLTSVSMEMVTFPSFYMDLFSLSKTYVYCGFCRKEGTRICNSCLHGSVLGIISVFQHCHASPW